MNHDVAMFFLGAFVVGFSLVLYRCTKVAERTADTAEAFEARRVARIRAEMRQRIIDELDYTRLSDEAEAWLKGVTR